MKTFSFQEEESFYARNGWPQRAQAYDGLERYVRCWLDPETTFRNKKVLDIGAGECTYSNLIVNRFAARRLVAMEMFPQRMLPAHKANQNPNLQFVSGDCYALPFGDGRFDVVFGSFILHHLPSLESIPAELRRVLVPGGLYVGIEPNSFHLVVLYRHLFRFRKYNSENVYLLSDNTVRRVFEQQKFTVRINFFFGRLPWLRGRFLGSCMGIACTKL